MLRRTLRHTLERTAFITAMAALSACGDDPSAADAGPSEGADGDAAAETIVPGDPGDDAAALEEDAGLGAAEDAAAEVDAAASEGDDDAGADAGEALDAGDDAGQPDGGEPDAGQPDGGEPDAGDDAGAPDAGLPIIVEDLPSTLSLGEGQAASLSVLAQSGDGSPLGYQWLRDGSPYGEIRATPTLVLPRGSYREPSWTELWEVDVTSAGGTRRSSAATITRTPRSWHDVGVAFTDAPRVVEGERATATVVDATGRTHVASAQTAPGLNPSLRIEGYGKRSEGDPWAYSAILNLQGTASELKLAASVDGTLLLVWRELASVPGGQGSVVRAALYRPAAEPSQPGSWGQLGTLHDPGVGGGSPEVVSVGASAYALGWVEGSVGARDAKLRTYVVPSPGAAPSSGWGDPIAAEGVAGDYSRFQLVASGAQLLALLYRVESGNSSRWQYTYGSYAALPASPTNLDADSRFSRVYPSEVQGERALLAIEDGVGRVYTRFARFDTQAFAGGWTYSANAYGSPPVPLLHGDGTADMFGVAVDTTNGYRSVLAQWHYTAQNGWSAATILYSDTGDFRTGFGMRGVAAGEDDSGNLVLAWLEARAAGGGACSLRAQRYSAFTRTWSTPVDVYAPTAPGSCRSLALRVPNDGSATAAWTHLNDGLPLLMHARLR
jgi:hypothetical protein